MFSSSKESISFESKSDITIGLPFDKKQDKISVEFITLVLQE
jgi:hypothetical protein